MYHHDLFVWKTLSCLVRDGLRSIFIIRIFCNEILRTRKYDKICACVALVEKSFAVRSKCFVLCLRNVNSIAIVLLLLLVFPILISANVKKIVLPISYVRFLIWAMSCGRDFSIVRRLFSLITSITWSLRARCPNNIYVLFSCAVYLLCHT